MSRNLGVPAFFDDAFGYLLLTKSAKKVFGSRNIRILPLEIVELYGEALLRGRPARPATTPARRCPTAISGT